MEYYAVERNSLGLLYDGIFGLFEVAKYIEYATLNVKGDMISRVGDEGGAG